MREMGFRDVLINCADYKCDGVKLSDIEGQFVCAACGKRGADIRPDSRRAERMKVVVRLFQLNLGTARADR